MKMLIPAALTIALLFGSAAAAQTEHHGDQGGRHQHAGWGQDYGNDGHHWQSGEHMGYHDWRSAQRVDYREHHLRQPPYGYEWREYNGQYVLAAIATGVIASIIMSGGH